MEYDGKYYSSGDYRQLKTLDAQILNAGEHLDSMQDKSALIQQALANLKLDSSLTSSLESTNISGSKFSNSLTEIIAKLKTLQTQGTKATASVSTGLNGVTSSVSSLGKRLIKMVKRIFFFTVIMRALRNIKAVLSSIIKSNGQLSTSLDKIKTNLWMAFSVI